MDSDVTPSPAPVLTSPPQPQRGSLWFDDGNVVLQAPTLVRFRVHCSVLALHSPVFRDMFSLPVAVPPGGGEENGDGVNEMVDGCPLVCLSDSSHDLEIFLRVLYCHISYLLPERKVQPLAVFAALLRLSTKYGFDELREAVVVRLERDLPISLNDMVARPDKWQVIKPYDGMIIDLINLLRETGCLRLLPVAFFMAITSLRTPDIVYGLDRLNDGGSKICLMPENQRALIVGKDTIHALVAKCYLALNQYNCNNCSYYTREEIYRTLSGPESLLATFPVMSQRFILNLGTCSCKKGRIVAFDKERDTLWASLPSAFGLPDWDD